MSFASVLKQMREIRGMSQAELARATGIQAPILCHYESGEHNPSIPNLRKLCEALNVGPETLLEYIGAHPQACPNCHGKGVILVKLRGGVSLREGDSK